MDSLALMTDLYQLTMACGYWKTGLADREACFHLYFRENPFQGGFTISCGLQSALEYLRNYRHTPDDLEYLASLKGPSGAPLFNCDFLHMLEHLTLSCNIEAVPDGTAVFPFEPLIRVTGRLVECQLLETPLLNIINFQTLIATKAARICLAARGDPVIEFGLRRAQGQDGGLSASKAAFVGGCVGTSNVLAGKKFGIPVKGTQAHSWVMAFDNEREAFQAWGEAMPDSGILLVDTYNSLEGVRHAVETGRLMREKGVPLLGIRLDSGDLAWLSREARRILDEAGFPDCIILASNDLDEHIIASLKEQGALINVWGVGTRLATGHEQSALGGIYKLSAVKDEDDRWVYKIKLSEQNVKINVPGFLRTRRFFQDGVFLADMIYDERTGAPDAPEIVNIQDPTHRMVITEGTPFEDLPVPVMRNGRIIYAPPSIEESQARARDQLRRLPEGIKRFVNPRIFAAGLERDLHDLRNRMILEARRAYKRETM